MCDACLYLSSVSILVLINAVAKAFTGPGLSVVFAGSYSWYLAFVHIFVLFLL